MEGTLELSTTQHLRFIPAEYSQALLEGEGGGRKEQGRLPGEGGPSFDAAGDFYGQFTLPSLNKLRKKSCRPSRWDLTRLEACHRRRYMLQHTALELFFRPACSAGGVLPGGKSLFLVLPSPQKRDELLKKVQSLRLPSLRHETCFRESWLLSRSKVTQRWVNRQISNFE